MQAHARAVETARSVSKITVNFFKTLEMHAANLTGIVEEAQTVNDHKLSEFEKKFEVTTQSHHTFERMIKNKNFILQTWIHFSFMPVGVCC